jgi:hypothetical protein
MVAPLWPHAVQRADCRSLSLDTLTPHRITGTAHATGARSHAPVRVRLSRDNLRISSAGFFETTVGVFLRPR